jgi:nucleotide-binding universal stress UspA family protein
METVTQPHAATLTDTHIEPVVVATDGLPQSVGALATARAIADQLHTTVRVIAVHRPMPLVVPDGQVLLDPNVTASLRADLTRRVRAQCADAAQTKGASLDELEVLNGDPARVITDIARDARAKLIVMGLGRHELVDRFFGDETALKVIRASGVPVLAVPKGALSLPRHAIAATDFSEGSVRAAQAALRLLAKDGMLELVHVVPRERLLFDAWVAQEEYTRFVRYSFTRFRARLAVPQSVRVDDVILKGDPGGALLDYAKQRDADLIAAGSHGHGFITRLVVGSVTTKLLRAASCAVLVIPSELNASDRNGAGTSATLDFEHGRWCEVLDDFTRRNVGRLTRLEVDDPDLGAQAQERDYPLLGVTFDPVDRRVEIMLGELGAGEPHLSRSIGDVDRLEVLTDADDQDVTLRLRHGQGQTILTLIR